MPNSIFARLFCVLHAKAGKYGGSTVYRVYNLFIITFMHCYHVYIAWGGVQPCFWSRGHSFEVQLCCKFRIYIPGGGSSTFWTEHNPKSIPWGGWVIWLNLKITGKLPRVNFGQFGGKMAKMSNKI